MRFLYLTLQFWLVIACFPVNAAEKVIDLNFEQALFEHLQENYLSAITLSEVLSEKTDKLNIKQQVLLSSSYYNYQLPQISLDLLTHDLADKVIKSDEDILSFQIAKNYYHDNHQKLALETFNTIITPINPEIIAELHYLKADIYIQNNDLNKAKESAVNLHGNTEFFPYIAHNLAVAYFNNKQFKEALFWMIALNSEQYIGYQDLKDSLLLAKGIYYLREKNYSSAMDTLLSIKKESSFAPKGLLALGQTLVLNNNINEGKRFLNYLSHYPKQNIYYQESLLYIAESEDSVAAEPLFKHAISNYDELLIQVNSLASQEMAEGLGTCLVNDIDNLICKNIHHWIESLEDSKAFKARLIQNKQLLNIQSTLYKWSQKLPVYEFILDQRKNDFDTKLPKIKNQIKPDELEEFKQQFELFNSQVKELKSNESDFKLMNEDESDYLEDIDYVDVSVKRLNTLERSNKEAIKELQTRAQFTKGILMWELAQKKPSRLREVTKNLTELKQLLKTATQGMKKLQQFNDTGDIRLTQLSNTLNQAKITVYQLLVKVNQLIDKNQQQLVSLTQEYLIYRKATLIHLNSRSKYLLTQLQDVQ